jgi:hypothetical protein
MEMIMEQSMKVVQTANGPQWLEVELPSHRTAQDVRDDAAARIPLSTVKRGEYFRVTAFEKGAVYQRGEYDKSTKRYSCTNQENGNDLNIKGVKLVFVGFEY